MLMSDLANEYLEEKRRRRRRSTVDGYASSIRLYLIPAFGGTEIEKLDPERVQEWVDSIEKPGAAEKAYKCLRQVVRWSIRKHRLRIWDPTQGIELPRKPAYRPETLGARQLVDRLRGFWGHRDEVTVLLSATLGLRPGEAYAMTWDRIDMRSGAVRVCETRQSIGADIVVYPPKTGKSDRVAYLPRFARDRIRDVWRASGRPKGLVNPDAPAKIARRIGAWSREKGLPEISMTNCRHTWATLAVEAGVQLETVAIMLGHSSVATAYDHYIRPRASIAQKAQATVQSYLFSQAR